MSDPETNQPDAGAALRVEKLVYGGQGLGRLEGRVVLVPFVLPGETVSIAPEAERRGVLEARLRSVLAPAEGRTDPPCPFFFRCGGCQYQHAAYAVQLEEKRNILLDALRRVGKLDPPGEISIVSGPEWGYRNRAQFHLSGGEIGYFAAGSHRLVPVDRCPISSPKIHETLAALREMLPDRRFPRFVRSLEVFTNETDVQLSVVATEQPVARRFFDWAAERIPGFAPGPIEHSAGGFSFRVRRNSFFQVNRFLLDPMIETALAGASGETALDLYAGVGLFSLPLARRFPKTVAVESGASAAGDLEFNAARAAAPVTVRREAAEAYLARLQQAPDFVLADPPRAGLGKAAVAALLQLKPAALTIVACDPATLARDLNPLLAGGYRIDALSLIDLFPQTFHIETVARLRWAGSGL